MRSCDDIRLSAECSLALAKHPMRLAVLCRVLWRARNGECFASLATLAADGCALSVRSVRSALAKLVTEGYLTATTEHRKTTRYKAGPRCPRKPHDSVFLPRSVWAECKPAAIAYYAVRTALGKGTAKTCAAHVVEAGRAAALSRASAYRTHSQLVKLGVLEAVRVVSKQRVRSLKIERRKVSNGAYQFGVCEYGEENTDLERDRICNTYSFGSFGAGTGTGWEGVHRDGQVRTTDWDGVPSKDPAPGRRGSDRVGRGLGTVDPGRDSQQRARCAVPERRQGSSCDTHASAEPVSRAIPRGTRSPFLAGWNELKQRAGKSLGLRAALTSTGLPSLEETLIVGAFSELSDHDTHLLPVVGEWIAAGGLSWHSDKKLSPWRFLARNLHDCIARAVNWNDTGRRALGSGRFNPAQTEDDDAIIHAATLAALRENGERQ